MVEIKVDPYKSVVILDADGEELTISEGDNIQFCLDSGLVKEGRITKLQGKGDKLKIQMMPKEKECEEIWPAVVISEGSLRLIEEDDKEDSMDDNGSEDEE